ncbi:MAG TPA: tetratricopeptide repeat protein [Coleofasciculaceae cyanobacterium]
MRERQLGADHPDTARSLNNLAALYESTGRYSEAEPLYLRAVVIFRDRLGETHPNTQTVWQNFVGCLQQAIESGQTAQLSAHPVTQGLLEQLR